MSESTTQTGKPKDSSAPNSTSLLPGSLHGKLVSPDATFTPAVIGDLPEGSVPLTADRQEGECDHD